MRGKESASISGIAIAVLAVLGLWGIHHQIRKQACPWLRAGVPRVKVTEDGSKITGTDRVTNFGHASTVNGRWAFYLLAVPADEPDKNVAARIKSRDEQISGDNLSTIEPNQQSFVSFQLKGDLPALFASSNDGLPHSSADYYLRLLFTYYDGSGIVHRTNSCYQLEKEPDQTISLFGCPFSNLKD